MGKLYISSRDFARVGFVKAHPGQAPHILVIYVYIRGQ